MPTGLKKFHITTILLITVLILTLHQNYGEPKKAIYGYVGSKKCMKCHRSDAIGNQYDAWLRTPHAKSVLILYTQNGMNIAARLSIENPSEDRQCLRCHTTGGGKIELTMEEGVGCEACHGPGEGYHEYSNHVDTINRIAAYETALKYGMYPTLGIKNIKKREKLCLHCHNNSRPCYPTDPQDIYRQTISLQVISEMKKGDLTLRHPLIPPFPQY